MGGRRDGGGGGGGVGKEELPSVGGCSVGLKTSHESETTAAGGGNGFGWKCDRGNGRLWPTNGDDDDDGRLDVLLSSFLLVLGTARFPSNLQY